MTAVGDAPFWEARRLDQMSRAEWEQLCDGCGKCCLIKLEDMDTGALATTRVACKLLDIGRCRCTDYPRRATRVPGCVELDPENVGEIDWLPDTCAYRLVNEGKPLRWWHPLVSGDPDTVHRAGVSVRGQALSERRVPQSRWSKYVIDEGETRKPRRSRPSPLRKKPGSSRP